MALTSVYYDGPVTEVQRAQDLGGAPEYGVYGPADFKVAAHPSIPYAVLVEAGRAHGHGVTDTADVDQVVQCATLASGTRWDLITVRRNWQPALGGPSELVALQAGTSAEIPASRKVGPGVEDDQPLALVRWTGGLSAPSEIIDLRVWAGNGSLVAKHDLVRAYLSTPGTRVWIEGVDWVRKVGANDIPEWKKVGDTTVADVPWTNLSTVQGFTPYTSSGWSGLKYAVKNGWVMINGAVSRSSAWPSDFTCAVIPAAYRPAHKIQGTGNGQVEPTVGNITLSAGSGSTSFSVTYPLI